VRRVDALILAAAVSVALLSCGGAQRGNPCDVGGKVAEHVQRLSGVAALVCTALGGDSEKCQRHTGFVDLAADTFEAGCVLVAE
jgi:hypothetical protein